MPTRVRRLQTEAIKACEARGHKMIPFYKIALNHIHIGRIYYRTHCERCEMDVHIALHPLPNEIEIGGEAVALNCALHIYNRI